MRYLYIDTSALCAIQFNLSHESMNIIELGVKRGDFVVLTNSIFEREFVKHCNRVLNEIREKLKAISKSAAGHISKDKIAALLDEAKLSSGEWYLERFIFRFKCKNIDSEINWRTVFDKYFDQTPPFSSSKKNEFPDAFVIEMLGPYTSNLLLITQDHDFQSWVDHHHLSREIKASETLDREIKTFKTLSGFSDFYICNNLDDPQIHTMVELHHDKLKETKEEITEHISNYFSDPGFFELANEYSAYISATDIDLENLIFKKCNIMNCNVEGRYIVIEYALSGDALITFEMSSVDRCDGENIWVTASGNVQKSADFNGKAKIFIDKNCSKVDDIEFFDEEMPTEAFEIPGNLEDYRGEDNWSVSF